MQQLVNFYNEDATNDKNMVAHNTAVFIEERIKEISVELGTVEKQVKDFRQQKQITDIQAEAQLYLGQTGQNEQKRVEIETQLNLTRFVEEIPQPVRPMPTAYPQPGGDRCRTGIRNQRIQPAAAHERAARIFFVRKQPCVDPDEATGVRHASEYPGFTV